MAFGHLAAADERREPRQTVLHRTRARQASGEEQPVTLVDVSPRGFMARSDGQHAPGDWLSVQFPLIGVLEAEVRWSLGGRIGCQLTRTIELADYQLMLELMLRSMKAASARA
ncbi:hypothetical protein ASG67_06595 [Sphingomonas sp. Leaf339]|uniref:PilZ domain-containing protein n=1 Tax=Sphingomonas sp. Leaf339 TaxID=1736343 RepID=UPI0006F9AF6D|nr:PilZ domain-containing protein [Sphingomonas sp. Leaf339]KQU55782.1 hypothetical protein ASG67_06595 [Sphingomonas sp. Leaf339]